MKIPTFTKGQTLRAEDLNTLAEAVRANRVLPGAGIRITGSPHGTTIAVSSRGRRSTAQSHPFEIFDVTDKNGLKVEVTFGAVIDIMDWQDPKLLPVKINGQDNEPNEEGKRPRLVLPGSQKSEIFVVIHQGEKGHVDETTGKYPEVKVYSAGSRPAIKDGTLYVQVATIHTRNNDDPEGPPLIIERIDQILGSHIVWPWKPDFMGWQQKKPAEDVKAALWLGAGNKEYIEKCDMLEDLYIRVQREDFDNGRDGDTVFELSMPEDVNKPSVLSFDKDQERGLEVRMSKGHTPSTQIKVDRKNTVAAGLELKSDDKSCSVDMFLPDEGGKISMSCKEEGADKIQARLEFDSEKQAVIDMQADEEKVISFTDQEFDNGRDGNTQFQVRAGKDAQPVTLSIDKNQQRGFETGAGEITSWIKLDRKSTAAAGFEATSKDSEASTVLGGPNEGAFVQTKVKEDEASFSIEADEAFAEIKAQSNKITQEFDAAYMEIAFRKEGFDNGRSGDTMFQAKAGSESTSLSLDQSPERGFEVGSSGSSSWLNLDRKSTAGAGFAVSSQAWRTTMTVHGAGEDSMIENTATHDESSIKVLARKAHLDLLGSSASITQRAEEEARIALESGSPTVRLSGDGLTTVSTVTGKDISMRLIHFMGPDGKTPMKAWFLASEPESLGYNQTEHAQAHVQAHQEHHQEDHDSHAEHGTHHAGHYVDPDHDPDDSGLGHGTHHAGHHQGESAHAANHHSSHEQEGHDDDEPHPHESHHITHHNSGQ